MVVVSSRLRSVSESRSAGSVFMGVLAFTFFGLRDRSKLDKIAALPLETDHGDDDRTEGGSAG